MPTSVPKMNLKISAVTVMGIIQGIMSSPRTNLAVAKERLKNRASKNPITN